MATTILPPLGLSGFEVYETEKKKDKDKDKEKNSKKSDEKEEKKNTSNSTDENVSDAEKDLQKFIAMNGEIKEIAYYDEMYKNGFDEDYEGMSNSGTVSFPEVDTARFFKGKKICLKKANDTGTPLKWGDLTVCLLGFIGEQTFSRDSVDIKLVGMSKLLDQEKHFTFTQTKRSKILKEMIEAAGLKCKIDVTGLKDDAIDYTNVSSSGSSSGSGESTGSATIDEAVEKAIEGKTDDLEKAKAIDSAFKSHVIYSYYFNSKYSSLDKAWKAAHLNCADGANVLCAMFIKGGFKAVIHHTPGEDGKGHYIVRVTVGGTTYATDNNTNSGQHTTRAFGKVWGPSSGTSKGTKIPM